MKKQKQRFLFKIVVVVFLVGYVLGSFANMLTIPRYVPEFSLSARPAILTVSRQPQVTDLQSVNPVKIFDRSTVENNSPDKLGLIPKSLVLPFTTGKTGDEGMTYSTPKNHSFNNSRYIYLSLRTFRI